MRTRLIVHLPLLAATVIAFPVSVVAQQIQKETISAMHFRAIQAAVPELERRKLNLDDYRITVFEFPKSPSSVVVLFHDPNIPLGRHYGSPGPRADFTVEIDKNSFALIKAYFNR